MGTGEFCNELGKQPLAFNPGTHWRYGTSADVLGAVIEVASGKSFRRFLKDELLDPLGMADTDFCRLLLEEAHVLVSPGSAFGRAGKGHFRIAATVPEDRLREAADRMEKLHLCVKDA
jgi:CubicO group peptidase (beta-lactamase class C family)